MDDDESGLLERVRAAFTGLPRGPRRVPTEQHCVRVREGLIDLFVERLQDHRARVHRVTLDAVEPTLARLHDGRRATVVTASLGIATTGTVVLTDVEPRPDDVDVQICLLHENRVVLGVPEALALLGLNRRQTWLGGPDPRCPELDGDEDDEQPPAFEVVVIGAAVHLEATA